MKGSVVKRGTVWYLRYDVRDPATGERKQKCHRAGGSTKREAEAELRRLIGEVESGAYTHNRKTVWEFLEEWLKDYGAHKLAPKTLEGYTEIVRNHLIPPFGAILLTNLTTYQIQQFYTQALTNGRKDGRGGLSPTSVLQCHRILHKALRCPVAVTCPEPGRCCHPSHNGASRVGPTGSFPGDGSPRKAARSKAVSVGMPRNEYWTQERRDLRPQVVRY